MKKISAFVLTVIIFVAFASCHTSYETKSLAYQSYPVHDSGLNDSTLSALLEPYGDSVNKSMNDVVGFADQNLEKKQPECELGNFLADAYYYMAQEKYHIKVDVAFFNYGGIRLTQLAPGKVTRGKIFELMPFDNLLVIQKVKGSLLQEFLDHTAAWGGWPVSGMTMQIKDKKAVHVLIGGKPLDPDQLYTTVNSDFVANGGDNAFMLKPIPQMSNGYLMRDAIFDYIRLLKSRGKNIHAAIENRVSYVH